MIKAIRKPSKPISYECDHFIFDTTIDLSDLSKLCKKLKIKIKLTEKTLSFSYQDKTIVNNQWIIKNGNDFQIVNSDYFNDNFDIIDDQVSLDFDNVSSN